MKIAKTLFWLCLIIGFIILIIGIYLSITAQMSDGYTTTRLGNIHHGMVNGFSALFLGVFVLGLAVAANYMHKEEKKRINKLK